MDILDLLLAVTHHLLVFMLAAILAAEWALVRPDLSGAGLKLLGRIDGFYGAIAMSVILVGIGRVIFGLKGWEFYISNHAFWAKMAAFVVVGLLSIRPTMKILAWRKSGQEAIPDGEIAAVRSWIRAEIAVFVLILVFAAAMARFY